VNKSYYVYILSNKWNTVLYVGVTGDLIKRVWQHKQKLVEGFSKKYNLDKLVFYEIYEDPLEAIKREKQFKAGSRKKKIEAIKKMNSEWKDLYEELV
jgi:putative endonuclease